MKNNPIQKVHIENRKRNRFRLSGLCSFSAVLICLVMLFLTGACTPGETVAADVPEIRLNSYILTEEPKGYDGFGTINARIDTDRLCHDLMEVIRISRSQDIEKEAAKIAEAVSSQFYLSHMQGLKNGDAVEIVWNNWAEEAARLGKEYGIVLAYENTAVSVSGLKELEDTDPFAALNVLFEGFDGYGTITFESSEEYSFSFSKTDRLSNGDTVTLELLLPEGETIESYAVRTGRRLTRTAGEYAVEGLTPLREADPFEYITAEYSGREPDGEAVFSFNPPDGFPEMALEKDRFSGLSNGDVIVLSMAISMTAEEYEPATGFRLTELSKSVTVGGLSGYVKSLRDIPEQTLRAIDSEAEEYVRKIYAKELGNNAELSGVEPAGHFLLVSGNGARDNYFGIVLKATVTDGKTQYVSYPFAFVIGLSMEENGGYSADSEMMRAHFSVSVKGRKGRFVMPGAKSLAEIKESFIQPAEQKFFIGTETDF